LVELLAQAVDELRIGNTSNVKYKNVPDRVRRPDYLTRPVATTPGDGAPTPSPTGVARAMDLLLATNPRRRNATGAAGGGR
jgi:hypothetical protein